MTPPLRAQRRRRTPHRPRLATPSETYTVGPAANPAHGARRATAIVSSRGSPPALPAIGRSTGNRHKRAGVWRLKPGRRWPTAQPSAHPGPRGPAPKFRAACRADQSGPAAHPLSTTSEHRPAAPAAHRRHHPPLGPATPTIISAEAAKRSSQQPPGRARGRFLARPQRRQQPDGREILRPRRRRRGAQQPPQHRQCQQRQQHPGCGKNHRRAAAASSAMNNASSAVSGA